MKMYLFILAAVILFFNGAGAPEVSAQAAKAVRAEVAFDFYVGERLYPAGVYRLETSGTGGDVILLLRGGAKGTGKQQLISAGLAQSDKSEAPKLVFRRIGEKYYLARIFMTRGSWSYDLPPSGKQRRADKKLAAERKTIEVPVKN